MTPPKSSVPVAVVTGASSGFGLLAAVDLALAGHRVFATMRDLDRRADVEAAAANAGAKIEVVALDVSRPESVEAAMGRVMQLAGRIDVLVNNAGVGFGGFFEDTTVQELRDVFETNFFGLVATMKAVVPHMREQRRGRIINVSSMSGVVAHPTTSAYCASKFAVEGLSESVRYELAPFGVYVVLVEPGQFRTQIFDRNLRLSARSNDSTSPYYQRGQRVLAHIRGSLEKSTADPREVARLIVRASTADRPELRYVAGRDARLSNIARHIVPGFVRERVFQRLYEKMSDPR